MSSSKLELPYLAVIPYNILIDQEILPAAKIYYGCLVGLSQKEGYCWAMDEQLAEQQGVDVRTIKRWNALLEKKGHITRVTRNVPKKVENNKVQWRKERKIYTHKAFSKKDSESDTTERDTDVTSNERDTDVPYKEEISKEEISKEKSSFSESKNQYGSDGLVQMTNDEYNKLVEKLKPDKATELIEQLNLYIASTGKKYKSHYHTILSWNNRNNSTVTKKSNSNPCLSDEARGQYDNAF